MMRPYRARASALHASFLAQPDTAYQADAWQTSDGRWHGSVRYTPAGLMVTIQGPPGALRELAAALHAAADLADRQASVEAEVVG